MPNNLHADFSKVYNQTSYQGHWRKVLITITNPGFQAVFLYRLSRWLMLKKVPVLSLILQRISEVWTGVSIPAETVIGPGLLILHFGGIMINGRSVLGRDCILHHEVTIGNKIPGGGSPKIGDRVTFGAGAKILGDIVIGNDVIIGANAVVLESLPDGAVAGGIPAKILKQNRSNSA